MQEENPSLLKAASCTTVFPTFQRNTVIMKFTIPYSVRHFTVFEIAKYFDP